MKIREFQTDAPPLYLWPPIRGLKYRGDRALSLAGDTLYGGDWLLITGTVLLIIFSLKYLEYSEKVRKFATESK